MCSVHKTAIPESYRKFKNSLLFVGNWNVTECFTADGLFAEMHQLAVEAEAEYYPLFSMELFGWYRSAPRAAEWGKDTVEKLYGKNKKTSPRRWCLCSTTAVTINLCRWLFIPATKAKGLLAFRESRQSKLLVIKDWIWAWGVIHFEIFGHKHKLT